MGLSSILIRLLACHSRRTLQIARSLAYISSAGAADSFRKLIALAPWPVSRHAVGRCHKIVHGFFFVLPVGRGVRTAL